MPPKGIILFMPLKRFIISSNLIPIAANLSVSGKGDISRNIIQFSCRIWLLGRIYILLIMLVIFPGFLSRKLLLKNQGQFFSNNIKNSGIYIAMGSVQRGNNPTAPNCESYSCLLG